MIVKKTPIYPRHVELGAKIVDFHSWLMPMRYEGIVSEHLAVRNKAGIFDVSHMGEFDIKGRDAYAFAQFLITNNLDKIGPGRALYTAMCMENGGMVDDLIVYIFNNEHIMLVVNASNIEKDFNWVKSNIGTYNVELNNISSNTGLIAVQGPDSASIIKEFLGKDIAGIKRFHFQEDGEILISRTGYTGENGFELFVDAERSLWLWDELMKFSIQPVGLGARDTLRLEKGYLLYGSDADDSTNPLEAGISWAVDLTKPNFIGKDALVNEKPKQMLVFIEMLDRGIPREGCRIRDSLGEKEIGEITSGTYSPSLKKGIAMGYIDISQISDLFKEQRNTEYNNIKIDIRGRMLKAKTRRR